ncbi:MULTISPECIES: ammonium transporter [unclassified Undibacterium]|uniref:ammonium transporter n=1 Tax=unclassified Undibacterium TaxID=2630295 RepID=UPI002AC9193B|nr:MULTISPECIES: ammonium transporter [unclassified Undibacterium]MEB0140609.1 ammonium transporter [Undibacterium sp. CCC2.1]MEB0173485.1 ammonium transporter [Undibacterium sp. CCC1.1]MEB0177613.1 ammonium transporter [Undibacterium sp. CCC3.4]MEB0216787.1 ammonium transporter [Undibacterium sp. 5I2]WPX44663.1 ammonium transporter [Undibacterium sp. CCC3.4]
MKNIFKHMLAAGAMFAALGMSAQVQADDTAPKADAVAASVTAVSAAAAPAVAVAAAPASSAVAPAAPAAVVDAVAASAVVAPVANKGDTAWMLVSTLLVILMTIPGLALFYGGLVRSKNMLSILMQVFMIFAVIIVLWCLYGYSLAFTEGNAFIGSFDRVFLNGIWDPAKATFSTAATFSKGVVIPEFVYVVFQATFAAITCGLIIGAFAERAKFTAVLLFVVLWFTFSYLPIAHMVWFWTGPDAIKDAASAATELVKGGFLQQKGALDFAGGTVVHINAAVAGLVGAIMIGKRIGYGKEAMAPHSLTMTMIGASLLWVGWFGFNAGSALEAGDIAALAFVNTLLATAAATVSWVFGEWMSKGKPSMLGGASGAVAGLVAITPACGYVGPMGALIMGLLVGIVCLWGVNGLKRLIGADDSLDVFGVHGVGGIFGALLTGVFASPALGGQGIMDYVANKMSADPYSIFEQVKIQATAVGTTVIWSAIVSVIAFKLVDVLVGLRVPEDEEREGLDITSHGESAYHS